MRKAVGVLLITLLLGSIVAAAGSTVYATTVEAQDDPYEKFWEILNKEAELVVQFNATGNIVLARELIQNSRIGAENAANISALIWQALEELKASGVKTHYTAEELREIARNISRNGLPQETVEALKTQGWTDEQIQALEDYIAKNAGEINEDFNMTAFLEEFSMAFIDVAFKYNEYETWTLKKWKWIHSAEFQQTRDNEIINPTLAKGWLEFYKAYSSRDYKGMEKKARQLRDSMYELLTGEKISGNLTFLKDEKVVTQTGMIKSVNHTTNGSLVFTVLVTIPDGDYLIWNATTYYWHNALNAYELLDNVLTLATAIASGNENWETESILHQKVAELKDSLKVVIVKSESYRTRKKDEPIKPTEPIYPINPKLPVQPVYAGSTEEPTISTEPFTSIVTITPADEITTIALNPEDSQRILEINHITITPVEVSTDYATYKVSMDITASKASAVNVKVKIEGTELEYSKNIGAINNGETITVESTISGRVYGDYEVEVSGKIKVTYQFITEYRTNSESGLNLDDTSSKYSTRQAVEEYSSTIKLQYDPTKNIDVEVTTIPQSRNIEEGDSVQFKIKVSNLNPFSVTGNYSLKVEVPYMVENNLIESKFKEFTGSLSLQGFDDSTVYVGSVTYPKHGTYKYEGYFKVGQYYKKFNGTIEVKPRPDDDSPSIKITPLDWPSTARRGNTVRFKVQLDSTYKDDREAKIELIIDDELSPVHTVETSVKGGSSTMVTLSWNVPSAFPIGEHSVKVKVMSRHVNSNDPWDLEASETKSITIQNLNDRFGIKLVAYPTELEGGGEVYLQVKAWNYDGSMIPVRGFIEINGKRENIDAKIPISANGDPIITLRRNIVGVGVHTIKVFLDNHDGEPNGAGEEHWSEATVEVKSMNGTELKQVSFECDNPKFNWNGIEYKATLVCKAFVYNPTQENVFLNAVSVSEWHTDNSDFTRSLGSSWTVEYPTVIQSSETATIIFKNTAHTGLITLERDLFGDYISISLKYVVSPQNGNDIIFTGIDTINIGQDNKDVIVDVGTNVILVGADVKAGITILKLARNGEVVSAFKNSWPYLVSFFRWAWPKLHN
ncbi:hypothetical protein GQS_06635 [Thermococcus sp. 4557]|uniref:hypothetical protein n=1 Tax=Thermococcus sp. (strain CGMCC 1.5172 / 4557) TaxID=1042877 RepID=UPI000219E90A|nr:hypothetical protein [Thermococcus sp. 4557]AEK73225.1 hypothetical protein GQS_06635 [Thermococcus sp. 4557]